MPDSELMELADRLIEENQERNDKFSKVDDAFYLRWDLPEGMYDWVVKTVSTEGHDAVMTATRVMSQWKNLRIKSQPIPTTTPDGRVVAMEANRQRANEIESALHWNLMQGMQKAESSLLWEIAFAAVQYAMPVVETVYLPYQEKVAEALEKDTKRIKALRKRGDYAFISHHPANVYPVFSMWGLESVLIVKVQTVDEFVKEWGKLAPKVVDKDGSVKYITSYDYRDYDRRVVWGLPSPNNSLVTNARVLDGYDIMDEPNELGFIPISVRRWGNSLSTDSGERVEPLLGTMVESMQWDMLNTFKTIKTTLAWKRAAKPLFVHKSPTGESVEFDYTESAGVVEAGAQDEIIPLPGNAVDQVLEREFTNVQDEVWQATMSRKLATLDFGDRTPASAVNQVLEANTGQLSPYKTLAEWCLNDVCHTMLCYARYFGDKYGTVDLYGQYGMRDKYGVNKSKVGKDIRIPSNTIEPDSIRLEITLTPDVPMDEQQKWNSAVLAKREFPQLPQEYILEEVGISNPAELLEIGWQELWDKFYIEQDMADMNEKRQMQNQMEMQQAQMQMQMQAQQAQAQQAQSTETQQQPVTENTGGLGGNPAAGGRPPVQAAPGQGEY